MRSYDYGFIEDLGIPSSTFGSMHRILSLNENLERMIVSNDKVFSKLMDRASVDSIRASNAIEGIGTSEDRMHAIAHRRTEPLGHDEMALAGYRDALDAIHRGWADMPFDDVTVCGLHDTICSYMGGGGAYKENDNVIVDKTADGDRIRWTPVPAAETEANMDSMMQAYRNACGNPGIEPIILIPCVILDFLCIHPFGDGNGRVSRLLTDLLLYRHGFSIQRYVSVDRAIDASKDRYYEALRTSSEGWHDNGNDYVPFIMYFIDVLNVCVKELDRRRISVSHKRNSKAERIESTVLESLVPISKSEICDLLLDVSKDTVEAVLARMLKEGRIVKVGTTRAARYRRA